MDEPVENLSETEQFEIELLMVRFLGNMELAAERFKDLNKEIVKLVEKLQNLRDSAIEGLDEE